MDKKRFYLLHEYYSPSHYHALKYLLEENDYKLLFYEIPTVRSFIYLFLPNKDKRFFRNFFFLFRMCFSSGQKVILGIAPYNWLLLPLLFVLRKHQLYYHTSYSCWDGTRMAHSVLVSSSVLKKWKLFTKERVRHIFAVSNKTRDELIKNGYAKTDKISVVNHSYTEKVFPSPHRIKDKSFLYVGRLTENKGIIELLDLFAKKTDNSQLTVIGSGNLEKNVRSYEQRYSNIHYRGYVAGFSNLIPLYKANSFLLLNSHRSNSWEELFGMVIIEAMACGCIPITTNHPGPKEIITDGVNGLICPEGAISNGIEKALLFSQHKYEKMRNSAIIKGSEYYYKNLAYRWKAILE